MEREEICDVEAAAHVTLANFALKSALSAQSEFLEFRQLQSQRQHDEKSTSTTVEMKCESYHWLTEIAMLQRC
jgi:cell fate (sporulation/competence/biofilm development) regulator YlbF (YheA/YmcA/DUF963 family)